jgi:aryl-alcohol dehydrogenase-like predicted oxidoreductase
MEYTKLGNSGMDVSRICVGCTGFGDAERGGHVRRSPSRLSPDGVVRRDRLGRSIFSGVTSTG